MKISISYNRKSTEDREKQVQSIADQRHKNIETAKRWNVTIDKEFTEEKTARKPNVRPQFTAMTELINDDQVKYLFCWKLDRLARNPIEAGIITYMLQIRKLEAIITNDRVYYPEDNALMTAVEFGMANQYSRDLSKNVKRGLESKREKGWMPNLAPNGYINERYNSKGHNRILIDEDRFYDMQKLWKLLIKNHYSLNQLVDIANNELRITTKKGKPFSTSTLHRIFNNPFYYGYFKFQGKIYRGNHKPMVSIIEFEKAQEILNGKCTRQKKEKAINKYNKLIVCGECSYTVIPEPLKHKYIKSTGETKSYKYWRCSHKSKTVKCTQKSIREEELELQMNQLMASLEIDEQYIEWGMKYVKNHLENEVEDRKKLEKRYNSEIAETKEELDRLLQLMISKENRNRTLLTEVEFESKKYELTHKRDELLDMVKNLNQRQDQVITAVMDSLHFCEGLIESFNEGDITQKREILIGLGRTIKLKDKKLDIELNKPFTTHQKIRDITTSTKNWVELTPDRNNKGNETLETLNQLWRREWDSNPRSRYIFSNT
jgi:site-specific DNA recombinase